MTDKAPRALETQLVHAGEPHPRTEGAMVAPIFQSATFVASDIDGARYIRFNNTPTHELLHKKLALIERGEAALTTASGMAATSAVLLSCLSPGDHLIAHRSLYGQTHKFLADGLGGLGISASFVDLARAADIARHITPKTRLLFWESLTSPCVEFPDPRDLVNEARARGLITVVDNTYASPVNFRPIELGVDVVIHSATKYLNGHGDIVAGAVIGSRAFIDNVAKHALSLGACLDPHAAFLLLRGMKTLPLRVRQQNATALELARRLERHSAVSRVNYPMLESSPDCASARDLLGGGGGLLSFELLGAAAADRFANALELIAVAPSLGGYETLVMIPARFSHAAFTAEQRLQMGVPDGLVRIAVGLEHVDDLWSDIAQALPGIE
jgi:cystathionine beta-lyase/cystathionine gamma-synthase